MPVEPVDNEEQPQILKGILLGMPVVAMTLVFAKLNFFGNFYLHMDYFSRDMGWPLTYREYFNPLTDDPSPWKLPILAVDLLVAYAMLVSVFVLMTKILRDWPKLSLRTMFVLTTVMVLLVWLVKFEETIRQILKNETNLHISWNLFGDNWLVRCPLLFGTAALCYGATIFLWNCATFHFHAIREMMEPRLDSESPLAPSISDDFISD